MLGPEAVARRAAKLGNVCPQDFDDPFLGRDDPGQKAQEGRFAGTGGADEKKPLSAFEREVLDDKGERIPARPRKPERPTSGRYPEREDCP